MACLCSKSRLNRIEDVFDSSVVDDKRSPLEEHMRTLGMCLEWLKVEWCHQRTKHKIKGTECELLGRRCAHGS